MATGTERSSTSSTPPPSGDDAAQQSGSFWSRVQNRKQRESVKKAISLKKRKDIDKKRRFITYPVYMTVMGLIIIALIFAVYYPLKEKYYVEVEDAKNVIATGVDGSKSIGWDEENGGALPVNELNDEERQAMGGKVHKFKNSLSTLKRGKDSDFKSAKGTFNGFVASGLAAEKYLGYFGMGMLAVMEGASRTESGGIAAASHFSKVFKISKLKNVTETFGQIDMNSTYNSIALDAAFKFSDILRICHHRKCQGMELEGEDMLKRSQEVLMDAEGHVLYTDRGEDEEEYLKKVSISESRSKRFRSSLSNIVAAS